MLYIFIDYWVDWVRLGTVISYVMLVILNVTMELSNKSKQKKKKKRKKKKKKETIKYDKNTIICDVGTT